MCRVGLGPVNRREGQRHGRRPSLPQLVHGLGLRHAQAPIKAEVRTAISKEAGDSVTIRLQQRLDA